MSLKNATMSVSKRPIISLEKEALLAGFRIEEESIFY